MRVKMRSPRGSWKVGPSASIYYSWFRTLTPGIFQVSVTKTNKFKQEKKTLFKVTAIGERVIKRLSELSSLK